MLGAVDAMGRALTPALSECRNLTAKGRDHMLPILLAAATLALYFYIVAPAINPRRWPLAVDLSRQGVFYAVLGLGFLVVFFHRRPELIPIIVLMITVHEYGHVLAYRLAGHRRPVFRLAPFGGVAFSERPASTQAESAFISMMGPGFSVALILAALLLVKVIDQSLIDPTTGRIEAPISPMMASARNVLREVLIWTAFLNFLNLLPFYPLDGGRTLRSLASIWGPRFADGLLFATTGLLLVLGLLTQSIFLALIAFLGLIAVRQEEQLNRRIGPIPARHAWLVTGAYLTLLAFLGYFSLPLLLGYFPFLQRFLAYLV